jgi:hypothetical protein
MLKPPFTADVRLIFGMSAIGYFSFGTPGAVTVKEKVRGVVKTVGNRLKLCRDSSRADQPNHANPGRQ